MNYTIVTIKAFGDFTIAAKVARDYRSLNATRGINIVAGEHVRSLACALGIEHNINFIGEQFLTDVPAIFDIKNRGVTQALKSIKYLRKGIAKSFLSSELVFDRLGWRERILGLGRTTHGLCRNKNIYIEYEDFFESRGYKKEIKSIKQTKFINRIVVIPSARMPHRRLQKSLMTEIVNELNRRGLEVEVVLIEGEVVDIIDNTKVKKIPREFEFLINSIKSADLLISADSLPAHLAAFFDIPVFVFTPTPNWSNYWLPKSAYNTIGMASFNVTSQFYTWLNENLKTETL
jgi:hypothetical protein